ncbi:MAG: rhodanese-like domain-containing protein [Saprospiraceae bacterium]
MYRLFQLLFIFVLAQCYPAPKAAGQFTEQEFEDMATQMAKGSVDDISTTELKLQQENIILLDTREQKEYNISHIPGAIWVGYDDFNLKRLKSIPKDAKVVTYCSVGYRSERIGEQLQKAGYSDVSNLKGSIFKWVNEGNSIVDENNKSTNKVHGFNEKWGRWVKEGKVVY